MAFKLPRLGTYGIVDPSGRPLSNFQGWINQAFAKIEQAFTDLSTHLGLISAAQSTADAANTAAAAAHADALAAQADADAANADLADIASDNYLSPVEKKRVIADVNDLNNEKTDIDSKATAAGVTTEKTNYDNSLSALNTYLSGLTTPVPWNNLSDNTSIVGSTFRANFSDVYLKRQLLLNAIDDKARQTATWTTVTGTGKPADNATVNNVTYSSTAPSSPVNGDIWVDTTGGGIVFKTRVAGAWQVASTANSITTSSTAPTSPVNGDVWVDTSVNPNVTRVRVSGSWVAASNLTTNTNQLTGTQLSDGSTIRNSDVTISGGNISGIGTGNGTTVANSSITITSGNLNGIGTGAGTAVANTVITITGGNISGIGTGNGTAIANGYVATGTNQVINSDLNKGMLGWVSGAADNAGHGMVCAIDTLNSAYTGMRHVMQATVVTSGAGWVDTGGIYADAFWQKGRWNSGTVADMKAYYMPVSNGQLVYARCLAAQHRCTFQMYLLVFDSVGNLIDAPAWTGALDVATNSNAGHDGNPAYYNVVGGTYTLTNANSAYACLLFRMLPTGGADPYIFVTEPAMGRLPAGQTVLPQYHAGPQDTVLGVAGSGYRIGDVRNLPAVRSANLGFRVTAAPVVGTVTTTNAPITITTPSIYMGSVTVNYGTFSVNISGTAGSTVTVYFYVDDPNYAGGTPSLQWVYDTSANSIYQNDGRIYLGGASWTYPTSGTSSGGGGGGDVGTGGCVHADSWIETQNRGWIKARDVVPGDLIRTLSDDEEDTIFHAVTHNEVQPANGYELTSASGFKLRCSDSTPLTLKGGEAIMPHELNGHELPVFNDGKLWWEPVWAEFKGAMPVAHISVDCRVYAAGTRKNQAILTHNISRLPKP